MAKRSMIAGPAIVGVALLVSGCQNIPIYNDSLNWFSWSKHDPEMKAIEAEVPPPGELEAKPAAGDQAAFVRDGRGGYVRSEPPPGAIVSVGAVPVVNASAAAAGNINVGDGTVSVADGSGTAATAAPLVGIRNSYAPSVTWRSARGAP